MFTVLGYMNSYPQRDHPTNGLHLPILDAFPPQLRVDPMSHPGLETWPDSHGYPGLVQGYACPYAYHHPYSYSFQPPQPHFLPPPYPHFPQTVGAYPIYPDPCAAYYVPPPNYSMRQNRFEDEKIMPREHQCCGCHGYPSRAKRDVNVKVGEQGDSCENKNDTVASSQWFKGFPHPTIWIPTGNAKRMDEEKVPELMKKHGSAEESHSPTGWFPLNVKSVLPVMPAMADCNTKGNNSWWPFPIFCESYGSSAKDETRDQETAYVKPSEDKPSATAGMEGLQNASIGEDAERSSHVEVKVNKESWKSGDGKKTSSSTKSTKLPPVSLRVDPLPRKKNGNGSSRSPSPPGRKQEQMVDDPKMDEKSREQQASKRNAKVIDVTETKSDADKNEVFVSKYEDKGTSESREETPKRASKQQRRILSETEAAALIQSVYRGYEVRRCEPLRKLKQIAEVRVKAAEIRNHIGALESDHGLTMDTRQKTLLGETIMKLLLQLDTIQGLHPSLRDMRKFAARELISLDEKLDALVTSSTMEISTDQSVEAVPVSSSVGEGPVGEEEETKVGDQHSNSGFQVQPSGKPWDSAMQELENATTDDEKPGQPAEVVQTSVEGCAAGNSVMEQGDTCKTGHDDVGGGQQAVVSDRCRAPDEENSDGHHHSKAIELPYKATVEELELDADLTRAKKAGEEMSHGEGSLLNLQKKSEYNEFQVSDTDIADKDVPEGTNAEYLANFAGEVSTPVSGSDVLINQETGETADQVDGAVGLSCEGTEMPLTLIGVEEVNQMTVSSCEEMQPTVYDEVADFSNEEPETSTDVTHQVHSVPEAANQVIESSRTKGSVVNEVEAVMEEVHHAIGLEGDTADKDIKPVSTNGLDVNEAETVMEEEGPASGLEGKVNPMMLVVESPEKEASNNPVYEVVVSTVQADEEHPKHVSVAVEEEEEELNEEHNGETQMAADDDVVVKGNDSDLQPLEINSALTSENERKADEDTHVLAAAGVREVDLVGKVEMATVEQNSVSIRNIIDHPLKIFNDVPGQVLIEANDHVHGSNARAMEESEKLREMIEKFVMVRKEQEAFISKLETKVKHLENKLLASRRMRRINWRRVARGRRGMSKNVSPHRAAVPVP